MLRTRLARLIVVLGVGCTTLAFVWSARATIDWTRSRRIQSGLQVVATVASVGEPSGHHQPVTLRYRDGAGTGHDLQVAYPLGLADHVLAGATTTVAYDPARPAHAELAFHPRATWQNAVLAWSLSAVLTAIWLRWTLRLAGMDDEGTPEPEGGGRPGPPGDPDVLRPHHVAVSAAMAASLLLGMGRLGLNVVARNPIQVVNFPPQPPSAAAATPTAVPLPAALTASAAASGPSVRPAEAERVVDALWPLRDTALAQRDVSTLRALETGTALNVDLATMDQGIPPERPTPDRTAPPHQTYVPRQSGWPASFLVEFVTTNSGTPWLEVMILQRDGRDDPWRVAFDTGYVPSSPPPHTDPPTLDAQGFDRVTPVTWTDPAGAVTQLARYWQDWIDDGTRPADDVTFAPGLWTTRFLDGRASSQGQRDSNGLPGHYRYFTSSDAPVWTFGVYDGRDDLVCSPMAEQATWTGPAHQDAHRQKWGRDLAPGVYRSVTTDSVREACVLVPTTSGPLVVFGADDWRLHTHGTPSS